MPTPPPTDAVPPTNFDTPARARQANSIHGNFGSLEDVRKAVLADVNPSVPEVELDAFFEHVWPKLPTEIAAKLTNIVDALTKGSPGPESGKKVATEPPYQEDRWVAFASDPAQSKENENTVFGGLLKIAKAIAEASASFSDKRVCMFSCSPDDVPSSIWRDNPSRPDGYFILKTRNATKAHWMDIVATGEYKKADRVNEINDDNRKAIWNMHHTLREDPRRRFTYAFTIENTTMRLWYGSRSDILVSKTFDFMKEPTRLIYFFLTMMFAPPTPLGFDPTMTCIFDTKLPQVSGSGKETDLPQYNISVGHGGSAVIYRTISLISSVGANGIQGRGTRVWKVVRADKPNGKPAVLKDSWIDTGRKREWEILKALRSEEKTAEQEQSLSEHFLTVIDHGDVYIDGKPDTTLSEEVRATLTGQGERHTLNEPDLAKTARRLGSILTKPPTGTHDSAQEFRDDLMEREFHTYRTKLRHRIVFAEVCTPLHDEESLPLIFGYLGEACNALRTMHELGWVHRDVSTGNILLYIDPETQRKRVILADLEYSKKMGLSGPMRPDVRTGTADFMALEVEKRKYLFKPTKRKSHPKPPAGHPIFSLPKTNPFIFNPLHDMEAILWIGTYFVSTKDVECAMKDALMELPPYLIETLDARATRLTSQGALSIALFRTRSLRRDVITVDDVFLEQMRALHPSVWPFWSSLEDMRVELVMRYEDAEKSGVPIPCSVAQGLHKEFYDAFKGTQISQLPYTVSICVLRPPKRTPDSAATAPNEAVAADSTPRLKRTRDDFEHAALDSAGESSLPKAPETNKRLRGVPAPAMVPATTVTRVTRSQSKSTLAEDC